MIYILEFSEPLHHARYYLGYCDDGRLQQRLAEHLSGQAAAITRAAVRAGIQLEVVVAIPGDRTLERKLKRQKNTPRIVRKWRAYHAING